MMLFEHNCAGKMMQLKSVGPVLLSLKGYIKLLVIQCTLIFGFELKHLRGGYILSF